MKLRKTYENISKVENNYNDFILVFNIRNIFLFSFISYYLSLQ